MSERELILRVCAIYMYSVYVCIYSMYVYIVHIEYTCTVCVQESIMCVCGGDLYTGDFEVICGC